MKFNKMLVCGATLLALSGSLMTTTAVFADDGTATAVTTSAKTTKNVVSEAWGKPQFSYGAGLNASQLQETLDLFGVSKEDVTLSKATGKDLQKFLGYGSGDDSVMFSTIMVTKQDKDKGVTVEILNPSNIQYSASDYYNPAVTSGAVDEFGLDLKIGVAPSLNVSGESALTGLYKVLENNGVEVDQDRANLAQEELTTTNDVATNIVDKASSENTDLTAEEKAKADEAYKAQLNQTLVDIKQELADIKEKQGELATKEDIEKIVNDALAKNNLDKYVSAEDVDKLATLAQGYQTTNGVLDKDSMAQLDKISDGFKDTLDNLSGELGSLGDKITGAVSDNQGFFGNLWQSVKDFFGGIGSWFSNLLNKEDGTTNSTTEDVVNEDATNDSIVEDATNDSASEDVVADDGVSDSVADDSTVLGEDDSVATENSGSLIDGDTTVSTTTEVE